jgi:hypothetical protein
MIKPERAAEYVFFVMLATIIVLSVGIDKPLLKTVGFTLIHMLICLAFALIVFNVRPMRIFAWVYGSGVAVSAMGWLGFAFEHLWTLDGYITVVLNFVPVTVTLTASIFAIAIFLLARKKSAEQDE